MQFRGVILEGNSNAGKTSTLRAIKKMQANDDSSECSVIVLGEHYSQILNWVHGEFISLSQQEHLQLLLERTEMLSKLLEWSKFLGPASRRSRGVFFVLERFHLNHLVAFGDTVLGQMKYLEAQLLELGAKCVLLTVSEDVLEQRIQSRNPEEWKNKSREEILLSCHEMLNAQNTYRHYAKTSKVETIEMNTDDKDWNRYAHEILKII